MVCLGNICRSPSAEGILRQKLKQADLANKVMVDSAGIAPWHQGEALDKRALQVANKRGYDLTRLIARQIRPEDFAQFDLILAMDKANLKALKSMPQQTAQVALLLHYALADSDEVADPYYGDIKGFEVMFDQLETACDAIITQLRKIL